MLLGMSELNKCLCVNSQSLFYGARTLLSADAPHSCSRLIQHCVLFTPLIAREQSLSNEDRTRTHTRSGVLLLTGYQGGDWVVFKAAVWYVASGEVGKRVMESALVRRVT